MKSMIKYSVQLVREKEEKYMEKQANSPQAVADIINEVFNMDTQPFETFVMMALDTKKRPVGCFAVSQGSLNGTIVEPREVFQRAILVNADSIVVAHNHPSGEVIPSFKDMDATRVLKEAGELLRIELVDHIIIGENGKYYSFRENGQVF